MAPLQITVGQLIDQLEQDLPDADAVARVGEARSRARELGELGDQLVDHFIQAARRGGASWSQIGDAMGVSKQAAQQRGSAAAAGRLARFTPRARAAVNSAQALAGDLRNAAVEPDHVAVIVLGGDGLAAKVVESYGANPTELAATVRASLPAAAADPTVPAPFSAAATSLLELTGQAAVELGNNYIGTEHMLLALLQMPDTRGAQVLSAAGIDHAKAHDLVTAALAGYRHQGSTGG